MCEICHFCMTYETKKSAVFVYKEHKKNAKNAEFFYKERKRMQRNAAFFYKAGKRMQRTFHSFYKERKRMRERFVLLEKNARTLLSFEKNICPIGWINFDFLTILNCSCGMCSGGGCKNHLK